MTHAATEEKAIEQKWSKGGCHLHQCYVVEHVSEKFKATSTRGESCSRSMRFTQLHKHVYHVIRCFSGSQRKTKHIYIYNTRASKHRGPDKEKSRKLSLGLSTSNLLGHARVRALMHPLMSKRRKNCIKCEFQYVHTGSSVCVCLSLSLSLSVSLSAFRKFQSERKSHRREKKKTGKEI